MDSVLSYRLTARDHYASGDPIVVTFRLMNGGDRDVWVLPWHTPLEGIKGRIFEVTCAGESVAYAGRMMKRGDPVAGDYIRIAAGDSASAEVDLREAYSLHRCDPCVVGFIGRLADVGWNQGDLPRLRDAHQPVAVAGNHVSFRIGD
jgi:peptidyl-Lys metalloendopeptidase